MPSCAEFLEHLSDYVDGRLDRRQARRFEVHLRRCDRCSRALGALRRGVAALRDADEIAPSPYFRQQLAERLAREVRIGDPIQPTSAGLAAALLIGAALGLTLMEPALEQADIPLVAERAAAPPPFRRDTTPDTPAPEAPLPVDVTIGFSPAAPVFSSGHRPVGMLALFQP